MPRTLLVAPPGGNGTPYYDVTGDGLITMLDAQAVDNYLGGQSGGWQNPNNRFDVDGDGNPTPTPSDALAIINELNARGQHPADRISARLASLFRRERASSVVSVLDAQQVIDKINGGDGTVRWPAGT